ncbi:methyltransferase domain-containing protein [Saccharothrix violaceirubra]|uniref:Arsenite methyltransferase n=1 Tax=Saccharothrix violaceirubra TaxID=413306 RepID=A0A7W7T6H7_9PSEU|nr:methyltransferase domain-containing protein [Saccharothrix violaceirubra]MBB4967468.1 SAM-dependent methyltransferase [Saccharothrix violaceirubra]
MTVEREDLVEQVRAHYAAKATTCCGPSDVTVFGVARYADVNPDEVPGQALLASLGCGNPTAVAALGPGDRVLDLGCGAGLDVILSARRVGTTGKVYGLDFLDEMLSRARENVALAGVHNVELLKGTIEAIPLPSDSVDVAISNCVINLSVDKQEVFRELFRVLRAGGRLGVSDVVADDRLSPAERARRGGHADCIAGALSFTEYREGLLQAGFVEPTIEATHPVADGMHGAIVRAVKPAGCCG